MITLVGIDIESIDEVATSLTKFGSRYTHKLFTLSEIESCGKRAATAPRAFASCFAAKEAVLKILDVRENIPTWKSISMRRSTSGGAEIVLTGTAADLAHRRGIVEISVDISHGAGVVIATVVAQARGRFGGEHP